MKPFYEFPFGTEPRVPVNLIGEGDILKYEGNTLKVISSSRRIDGKIVLGLSDKVKSLGKFYFNSTDTVQIVTAYTRSLKEWLISNGLIRE